MSVVDSCDPHALDRWWSSPIISVSVGALIALLGTILSGIVGWHMQKRNNAYALQLQEKRLDAEKKIRKENAHRVRGEELYGANARLREELRAVTTSIAKKLEDGTFNFWDTENFFVAGRDSLSRISLLVELDYPELKDPLKQLANAFHSLTHTMMPNDENSVSPFEAAPKLLSNMTTYAKASQLFSETLIAEMKKPDSPDDSETVN